MSYITHSGYGYSKRLCEDVTSWFLNRFFPRHKIALEIVHLGLKSQGAYGYCDCFDEDNRRHRQFLIEIQTHMSKELYIKTLLHELTHMRQWVEGSLRIRYGKMCYNKKSVEDTEYWYQPHEIEAREQEKKLYVEYIKDNGCVR